jgi:hypothetical protein
MTRTELGGGAWKELEQSLAGTRQCLVPGGALGPST